MPEILEDVIVDLERMDLASRRPLSRPDRQPSRSPGIHLSGVLRHILTSGRLPGWDKYVSEIDADEGKLPLLWFLGIAWEEACVSLYPEVVWQPGEVQSNAGVWMTCDGLSVGEYGLQVEEFKYTSAGVRTAREFLNDWLKIHQGLGYCGGYGAEVVRWHICYNRSVWAPVYKRMTFRFTEEEIERDRWMIQANIDGAIEAGYGE